jgi:EAL domain-containing protein (putative c-di-GMP-specific phosphodiesterase class I)
LARFDRRHFAGPVEAVDDMGSGFASLTHTLRVRPDIVKLDISLIRDIDTDPVRMPSPAHLCPSPRTSARC